MDGFSTNSDIKSQRLHRIICPLFQMITTLLRRQRKKKKAIQVPPKINKTAHRDKSSKLAISWPLAFRFTIQTIADLKFVRGQWSRQKANESSELPSRTRKPKFTSCVFALSTSDSRSTREFPRFLTLCINGS
jgi:hypothetical protein